MTCQFYWGSHGCDKTAGHDGTIHQCGGDDPLAHWQETSSPCSQHDESTGLTRGWLIDQRRWSDWVDHAPGSYADPPGTTTSADSPPATDPTASNATTTAS